MSVPAPVGSAAAPASSAIDALVAERALVANFQKKGGGLIDVDPLRKRRDQTTRRSELIVVGSLLEKLPNMAGLTRTCEVLGSGTLVLPSATVLADREYQSVAVTSDRWAELEFVAPGDLVPWLEAKRDAGYALVGLEQTPRSVLLHEHEFAPRTVVVVGNERLGMPDHLISLMDVCVEIPQASAIVRYALVSRARLAARVACV